MWMRSVLVLLLGMMFVGHSAGQVPDGAFWNEDGSAAIVAEQNGTRTKLAAFVRQPDGEYLEIDISPIEGRNLGRIGSMREGFERAQSEPIEWCERSDDIFCVEIRTRAWYAGKRYTSLAMLLFRADGTVFWQ